MINFDEIKKARKKKRPIDPRRIFRRLIKPPEIIDLYASQDRILEEWFKRRTTKDLVLKLHTGGGKTLVGLLIGKSALNETKEPVLYLVPNKQLVAQTIAKAKEYGIPAVPYETGSGVPLPEKFVNCKAICVGTYKSLFNGSSKFGVQGSSQPTIVGQIILDDAHVAFDDVRDSFTMQISSADDAERYEELTTTFRQAFKDAGRLGTFDDVTSGEDRGVIEVPFPAWLAKLESVRTTLTADLSEHGLVWPLLRDRLHACHALITSRHFTITPILPFVDALPTFAECQRRVFMSATLADDSEIVRTFGVDADGVADALTTPSVAGVSERMILIPDLMDVKTSGKELIEKIVTWSVDKQEKGTVILVPSDESAAKWADVGTVAKGPKKLAKLVSELQSEEIKGPAILSNRYDGIDLPGDSCRLLILFGLPRGTSDFELFRAAVQSRGSSINRLLAQRVEQGIGRAGRGSRDYCVVLLGGADLAGWVSTEKNLSLFTAPTRAQLEMGLELSETASRLTPLIRQSFERKEEWIKYHTESLEELVERESTTPEPALAMAATERKALSLWLDGHHSNAVARIRKACDNQEVPLDPQTRGWLLQLAARIAEDNALKDKALELQREAYGLNKSLLRPSDPPPYEPMNVKGMQAERIVDSILKHRVRRGFIRYFDDVVSRLTPNASAGQFEQSLADLGAMLGFVTDRFDDNGKGPDLVWLLSDRLGLVIEAKSRKKKKNALTKDQHGQLLVAEQWFKREYSGFECKRVSVQANCKATNNAEATQSFVLTFKKINGLVDEGRELLENICDSSLPDDDLVDFCKKKLLTSKLQGDDFVNTYLQSFVET